LHCLKLGGESREKMLLCKFRRKIGLKNFCSFGMTCCDVVKGGRGDKHLPFCSALSAAPNNTLPISAALSSPIKKQQSIFDIQTFKRFDTTLFF